MRAKKDNERIVVKRGGFIEYWDELDRNTYYYNPQTGHYYEKEWIRLANGEDRESHVYSSSNGYWRKHWYDIHTGRLLRELDSNGEINLISKRHKFNQNDEALSEEYKKKGKKALKEDNFLNELD